MFSDKLRFNGSNVDRCRVHRRLHERYVKTSLSLNATHFESWTNRTCTQLPASATELTKNLGEWQNIPRKTIQIVCQSTTHHLPAVIDANGVHNRNLFFMSIDIYFN